MKSFIEELYYGNIDPQNSGFEDDESVQRTLRTISENEDWLTEHLTGEEKKRFLDFADAWSAFNGDATLDGFITGFRLGARFVLDICNPNRCGMSPLHRSARERGSPAEPSIGTADRRRTWFSMPVTGWWSGW